jgi:hypothetical protein
VSDVRRRRGRPRRDDLALVERVQVLDREHPQLSANALVAMLPVRRKAGLRAVRIVRSVRPTQCAARWADDPGAAPTGPRAGSHTRRDGLRGGR